MATVPAGVEELDAVLAELVDTVRRILREGLVGVCLQGSFALGGWDAGSDCTSSSSPPGPSRPPNSDAPRAFHAELPARPSSS